MEARLEEVGSGLAPVTDGWFVVGVADAAWLTNEAFGARCVFEGGVPVLRARPDLPSVWFPDLGVGLHVLEPGHASGLYHGESGQEDFLVLSGECLALVEGEERPLRAWDFVHCPPGTEHVFVWAGDGPCVLLLVGARGGERRIRYPRSELALRYGAGAEAETSSPRDAYAASPHWQPARPAEWEALPWGCP